MGGDHPKEIGSGSVAHIIVQVRSKQLSIKDNQDELLKLIKEKLLEEGM